MSSPVRLRRAGPDDAERVLFWRNDPRIVALSKSRRPVTRDEHMAWYEQAVKDARRLLCIVEIEEPGRQAASPAGVVRVDRDQSREGVITIYLLASYTGRGLGVAALEQATNLAFAQWPDLRSIRAEIRPENLASIKAFGKAGFVERGAGGPDAAVREMSMDRPGLGAER
jgi:UDP-2,4-diacetamido-2,4,6-trideoxy-beta-L-altropyranose hydrolase